MTYSGAHVIAQASGRAFRAPIIRFLCACVCILHFGGLPGAAAASTAQPLTYEIVTIREHDPSLFTQGLLVQGDLLIETAGGYGSSRVRRYHADEGHVIAEAAFPRHIFAEGVAQVGDELYVLSWRNGICFVLEHNTLAQQRTYRYKGEGWGLTFDGEQLIMSDGSHFLFRRDPQTFNTQARIAVSDGDRLWSNLNELEFAENRVWANVWQDTRILAINPNSGEVEGILDLANIVAQHTRGSGQNVLNGIAYDEQQDAYWITGKLWPRRYLIKILWPEKEPL